MPPVFEQVTFFYEVLLRFGDQPGNRGMLTGAHLQKLTQAILDGKVIATTDNGPKPLALLDNEDGEKLADVLGEVNTQTLMQNQLLTAALAVEKGRADELTGELSQAQMQIQSVSAELTVAKAEVVRLTALVPTSPLASDVDTADQANTV
ncbi:hypothetical protein [Pseudomonas graminis]|uniref:hypothetical protein n=1 Tax=Pseudomonas graminis TaxID=158627 RepID=UPI003C2884D8